MNKHDKIYLAGHTGLVGSAIGRKLKKEGFQNLLLPAHRAPDLTDQPAVEALFAREEPDYVIVAAGLVGGIQANQAAPADFFAVNMAIALNIIQAAHTYGVKKLLYLGSACMYPKDCPQPMREEALLTGLTERTNEGYALAKICGSRLCGYMRRQYGDDFISAVPANAYGKNDCFDPQRSHVIPALIRKYHQAKMTGARTVELWGSGTPLREFLYTDDLADACLFLMEHYSDDLPVNIGSGEEVSMLELSRMAGAAVGYEGETVCNPDKPDGMMRRIVDTGRLDQMGWKAKTRLRQGLDMVYADYLARMEGEEYEPDI